MFLNINEVTLMGFLTKDPYTVEKKAELTISINENWKKDGKRQQRIHNINVVVFGNTNVNFVKNSLTKGNRIYIRGKMSSSKYEKDGQTHYSQNVVADHIEFVNPK